MTKRILIFLLVVGLSLWLFPATQARASTDSVEIYVGYFGETYVKLVDVSKGEMEGLAGCNEYTYSSIDNGGYTRYQLAYGVPLESLLSYVGIATADVDTMYFLGTDSWINETFTSPFGVPRYYFPYLAENYNQADPNASNVSVITSYYEEVPSILAFEQTFNRDTGAFDYDKYKSGMSDENCLRLAFGQQQWNEVTASDSVKWVYRITVNLTGSPITASNWDTQVGSAQALEELYEVNTGYDALDELIKSGLQITTDNPSVVQVINGEVRAIGEGTARIYIEYSDSESGRSFNDQIYVTVTGDPNNSGDGSGEGGWTPPEITDPEDDGDDSDLTPDDTDFSPDDPNNPDGGDDTDLEPDEPDLTPDEPDLTPGDTDPDDTKPDDSEPDSTEEGEGAGGNSGYGGDEDDGSNGGDSGSGTEDESGTPGIGTDENQTPSGEGSGDEGTDSAAGGVTTDDPGAAERIREGMEAGEESVPLSGEGEAVYDQIKEYMEEQLEGMDEVPDTEQIASLTEDVRRYIEELIEQAEEEDEPLDLEEIIEMVEEYIDEIVEEAEAADEEMVEELSEEETSEDSDSSQAVYLSLGNLTGGDSSGGSTTTNGSMSSGNTAGGSGGKVLEIESLPLYYTVILIVALAALFVGGGTYRSLRFRRETAER